jgi:nitrogen regulatory protein PII-like uncharacterized protein
MKGKSINPYVKKGENHSSKIKKIFKVQQDLEDKSNAIRDEAYNTIDSIKERKKVRRIVEKLEESHAIEKDILLMDLEALQFYACAFGMEPCEKSQYLSKLKELDV